jgi:hypothetical protein
VKIFYAELDYSNYVKNASKCVIWFPLAIKLAP